MKRRARLKVKSTKSPSITITRFALLHDKLVYVGRVNKPIRYPWLRSRVVYIGTTKRGPSRIATSAAKRAGEILEKRGLKILEFLAVTCGSRPNVKTWRQLEGDLLLAFRAAYGALPICNKKLAHKKVSGYFSESRLKAILGKISA